MSTRSEAVLGKSEDCLLPETIFGVPEPRASAPIRAAAAASAVSPILLSKKIPWFGEHTGYQQLPRYLSKIAPQVQVIAPQYRRRERVLGKFYSMHRGWSGRNQCDAAAEFRFERANSVLNPVRHILHLEEHTWFLDRWEKAPRNLIGTLHLPPDAWTDEEIAHVKRLSSGIVLYRRDLAFFESLVGAGRVQFIAHGADVEFFRPNASPAPTDLLFTGHYLRNTKMLARVIPRLSERWPDLRFNILVPEEFRHLPGLTDLRTHPKVVWHQRLNDDQLRALIASAYLLLLPMNNSGANTAVVEALACGTPIVTTDVGGIRDYGGGSLFPIVTNDDDDAMIALVERYLREREWRDATALKCRQFAETELAWPLIARQHMEVYEALAKS
jgi:glycosyltransferase involved in cell wall biosynthesis